MSGVNRVLQKGNSADSRIGPCKEGLVLIKMSTGSFEVSTEARRERTSDPLELKLVSCLTPSLGTNPGPLECQHRMLTTTQSA